MKINKEKLLFIFTIKSTFVNQDIDILGRYYRVIELPFHSNNKILTPIVLIKQLFQLIIHISNSKFIISQLAGYHTFIPTLLSKIFPVKVIIFAGGTDCVNYPQINYGNFSKFPINYFTAYSFKNCDFILPKHRSLIYFEDHYNFPNTKQGIYNLIPKIKTPWKEITNGFDHDIYQCNSEKVTNSFITAAFALENNNNVKLKGIDLILKIAPLFQNCSFTIIGGVNMKYKPKLPNINYLPYLKTSELIKEFSKSQFYLQLSMSEGFPNSICEAMLCECIPIASNVNALPDIIDPTGFVLMTHDVEKLNLLIEDAIKSENKSARGKLSRNKIKDQYPLHKRDVQLIEFLHRF